MGEHFKQSVEGRALRGKHFRLSAKGSTNYPAKFETPAKCKVSLQDASPLKGMMRAN